MLQSRRPWVLVPPGRGVAWGTACSRACRQEGGHCGLVQRLQPHAELGWAGGCFPPITTAWVPPSQRPDGAGGDGVPWKQGVGGRAPSSCTSRSRSPVVLPTLWLPLTRRDGVSLGDGLDKRHRSPRCARGAVRQTSCHMGVRGCSGQSFRTGSPSLAAGMGGSQPRVPGRRRSVPLL